MCTSPCAVLMAFQAQSRACGIRLSSPQANYAQDDGCSVDDAPCWVALPWVSHQLLTWATSSHVHVRSLRTGCARHGV